MGKIQRGMRVLIVDDDSQVRALGRALVQNAGGTVVGEAGDGEAAVERAASLGPDLVLMDMRMPGGDGAYATRELMARRPDTRVIAWTSAPTAEVQELCQRLVAMFQAQQVQRETLATWKLFTEAVAQQAVTTEILRDLLAELRQAGKA